jgi:hypothetical protein
LNSQGRFRPPLFESGTLPFGTPLQCPHPDLNGDFSLRRATLYPIELWGLYSLILEILISPEQGIISIPFFSNSSKNKLTPRESEDM